jgi:hypothetical protein
MVSHKNIQSTFDRLTVDFHRSLNRTGIPSGHRHCDRDLPHASPAKNTPISLAQTGQGDSKTPETITIEWISTREVNEQVDGPLASQKIEGGLNCLEIRIIAGAIGQGDV